MEGIRNKKRKKNRKEKEGRREKGNGKGKEGIKKDRRQDKKEF